MIADYVNFRFGKKTNLFLRVAVALPEKLGRNLRRKTAPILFLANVENMTNLNKPIKRSVILNGSALTLIVELKPSGIMSFHEKRCRRHYDLPIMVAYRYAVHADAAKRMADKIKIKENKKRRMIKK